MLGISRRWAKATWSAVFVLLLVALVYLIRNTIFVFVVALLFAYLLSPLVNLVDRVLPSGRPRGLGLFVAYVIFIGVVGLIGFEVVNRVIDQAQAFSKNLPEMMGKLQGFSAPPTPGPNDLKGQILNGLRTEIVNRVSGLIHALPAAGVKLLTVMSDVVFIVVVPILAFFFLKDGLQIRQHILALADAVSARARVDSLMEDIHRLLAHYMRVLLMLSLATFVSYGSFFLIIKLPFGILLAVIAGVLEIIPMVGPLTAAIIILVVTAISGAAPFLLVGGFLALYRIFQDYVLSPHLMGHGVELHPLIVLFGVFAGAELGGVGGCFLSVPVLAMARILYLDLWKARQAHKRPPEPILAETPMRR